MNPGTNRPISDLELSRLLVDYYRDDAARGGEKELYDARVEAVLPHLEELSRRGVEAAFVLHVLICTSLGRKRPNWETWPSQPVNSPMVRRTMLRAIRTLSELGRDTVVGLFGENHQDRGSRFYSDLGLLEQMLGGATYHGPAFQLGAAQSPGPRRAEVYRRACLACLMSALDGHSKRATTVALLLKQFGLLPTGSGRRSEWIKRRYRLDAKHLKDPLSELGTVTRLLRTSFDQLRERLAPETIQPGLRQRLRARARLWRIPVSAYERHFLDFCRLAPAKPDDGGLEQFEANLRANSAMRGGRVAYRKLLLGDPAPKHVRGIGRKNGRKAQLKIDPKNAG